MNSKRVWVEQIIISFKGLPKFQKSSSFFDNLLLRGVESLGFFHELDDLVMGGFGLGFVLLPDGFLVASLDPFDLDDSGDSAGRVGADGNSKILSETVLEPGGWPSVSSCSAILNLNRRHIK